MREPDIINTSSCKENPAFKKQCSDYVIGKEIGKGAYAIVKQCIHKPTSMKLAVKIYEKFRLTDSSRKHAVKREIQILRQLDHENILKLYEVIDTSKQIWIVTELIEGVSLLSYLKSLPKRRIDESTCKYIFTQIIDGINYLHLKNIYHRDIKLENIIINNQNKIKIIDFGFGVCGSKQKMMNFFCGTPSYMAPEIVQKRDYLGQPVDVWSIGILLFTLLCGTFPFRGISEKELYSNITKGSFIVPEHVSVEGKNLIQNILLTNPSSRLDGKSIRMHEWLIV